MTKQPKIFTSSIIKIVLILVAIIFSFIFYFKEEIKEHKVTKAKMEMLKRMLKTDPEQWPGEFNEVYDSMIVKNVDTISVQ